MLHVRQHLLRHRALAAWLLAAALLVKVLVPAGYMVSADRGWLSIELCSGYGPVAAAEPEHSRAEMARGMAEPTHVMPHHEHPRSDKQGKEMPCAFSVLAAPSLSAADPVLLTAAIAFIVLLRFRVPSVATRTDSDFLRPPPRGPPFPS